MWRDERLIFPNKMIYLLFIISYLWWSWLILVGDSYLGCIANFQEIKF